MAKKKLSVEDLKGKMSFQMSDRDKKLVMVVVAVAIVAASYLLGFTKFNDLTMQYQAEANKLHATQKDLIEKTNNRAKYEKDTAEYKKQYNAVFANYGSSIDQSAYMDFLNKVEMITGVWIKGVTFSESTNIYTFGKVRSTNPSAGGTTVYNTDLEGWKTTLTLSYEAEYAEWKSMIAYINNYYSKNSIESISMAYNSQEGTVTGTISLAAYSVTGSNRKYVAPEFNLPTGTDNIFNSSVFDSTKVDIEDTNGDYILSNYDLYILLNSAASDMDSVVMGKKSDLSNESVVTANSNAQLNVSVRFFGTAGNYRVQYTVGDKSYPVTNYDNGSEFEPGNTMDMLIMSSPRIDASDTGYITLNVTNDSDMNLNIKICNDDVKSSRVRITETKGEVSIFQ